MRSFNANFITEKNKRSPDGPTPINLITFNFATPIYLSDRNVTPSGGSLHKGLIKEWGFIDSNIAAGTGGGLLGAIEICDLQLTIINSEDTPFSNNFTATDPPENVIVELYQWFSGLTYSEKEIIFKGIIFGSPVYDLYECKLVIRGIWEKYNKLIGEDLIVNPTTYPNADPDDIGKMLPLCWGPDKKVPFRAVDAGALSTLVEDITSSATTITLSDSSRFPSSGTVQIDNEKITYTGNSSNQLTGCTRGSGGTTAVAHTAGSYIIEIKTEYFYILGCPVKTISTVYVDNIRKTSGFTAYTGQSGDEHASYPGKACIKFTALPIKLIRDVNDDITVSDNIAVTTKPNSTHYSADSDIGYSHRFTSGYYDVTKSISGTGPNFSPTYTSGNSKNGYSEIWDVMVEITSLGSAGTLYIYIDSFHASDPNVDIFKIVNGAITIPLCSPFIKHHTANYPDATAQIRMNADSSWDGDVYIKLVNVTLILHEYEKSATKTGSASRSNATTLTGNSIADTVIGGQVTADIDGYQDDASGTYTGTTNSLIKRPDHVFKHIWNAILGASLSDIDSSSFNSAGTFFNTNSYEFSLVITDPIQADELLMRLALQCRSHFFVSLYGTAKLIVRQTSQSSTHSIIKNEIKQDSVSIERSSRKDIINYFNIYYDLDHSKDKDLINCQAVKNFQDSTSISRYGQKEWMGDKNLLLFDAITLDAMAVHVGSFLLDFYKQIRHMPHCAFFLDNMETEPGDIIDLTHDLDNMDGFVCEVIKILHFIGSAKKETIDHLQIIAIEN